MDEANRILTQIQTVKGKIAYHEEELCELKTRYEHAMKKKISEIMGAETEPKAVDQKMTEKEKRVSDPKSSLTPNRLNRKDSSSSSSDGASRKKGWFDSKSQTRNEGPKPKQKRNTDANENLIRMLIAVRGRSLECFDRSKIVRIFRETLPDHTNSPYRLLDRYNIVWNNVDFIFNLYRKNLRDTVHNAISFLHFTDEKHAHYLRAKIEINYLNSWDQEWFIALAQIKDVEVVRGQGSIIETYHNFESSELFTIVNILKCRTRGYQGYPKEKVDYSAILESDDFLARKFNRKELGGQFNSSIKRFTIFDEAKRSSSNSKIKDPQPTTSKSNTHSTTGWGNSSQSTSGWGTSSPRPWGSPQRSESDSWSQITGPLLNVPNYQLQLSQGQINQSLSQMHPGQSSVQTNIQAANQTMTHYPGMPGTSGVLGQNPNMGPYGPLMCPPYGPQNISGPQGPPGPSGVQNQSNFQGPFNPGLTQPYQLQANLCSTNSISHDPQKPIEVGGRPLDLEKEKIDSLKKDLERTADEIVAPKDAQGKYAQQKLAQEGPAPEKSASSSPPVQQIPSEKETEKLETINLLLISESMSSNERAEGGKKEDITDEKKDEEETVPKKKTADAAPLSPEVAEPPEKNCSELTEEELLKD